MDEPFSALDVFTAETLRSEVYRLWTASHANGNGGAADAHLPSSLKSILMITHIIEEAVFLADRIVIMGTRPGHVRQVIPNTMAHPRDYQSPQFLGMVQRIHDIIVREHLPEEAPAAAAAAGAESAAVPMLEPLPCVNFSTVIGLMEILDNHGGRMDIFAIDQLTDYDFGQTLSVIKAGEMLEFLDTPKNDVLLTDLGRDFLARDINGRKQLLNQQLRKLATFRFVLRILEEAKDHALPRDIILEEFAMRLPTQDPEALLRAIIGWGRYAELLSYSSDTEVLSLVEPAPADAHADAAASVAGS